MHNVVLLVRGSLRLTPTSMSFQHATIHSYSLIYRLSLLRAHMFRNQIHFGDPYRMRSHSRIPLIFMKIELTRATSYYSTGLNGIAHNQMITEMEGTL